MSATVKPLSHRESQIVRLLAVGRTFDLIAAELGISPRTVKSYCDQMRWRLGVATAREIPAAYAEQTGVSPWPEVAK